MGNSGFTALPQSAPWWAVLLDHLIIGATIAVPILLAHRQGANVVNGSLPKLIDALRNSVPIVDGQSVPPAPVATAKAPTEPEPPATNP